MYKNSLITFGLFVLIGVFSIFYFSAEIKNKEEQLLKKQQLISKYKTLSKRYSKKALLAQERKFLDLLGVFGVVHSVKKDSKKRNIYTANLNEIQLNKISSYIANSQLMVKNMKIVKIDQFSAKMDVSFE